MKIKKNFDVLVKTLMVGLGLFLFFSCTGNKDEDNKTLIVLSMPGFGSSAPQWAVSGAKKYIEEHPELNIKLMVFDGTGNKQLSQVEGVLPLGPKAIIFWPTDPPSSRPIMAKAKEAGVPVVGLCNESDGIKAWVGSDDAEAGVLQMEMLKKDFGGNAKIAILEGGRATTPSILRVQGYNKVLEKNPGLNVVVSQENNKWNTETSLRIAENWIQAGLEFDAVVGVCDDIVMGGVIAGENAGKSFKSYGVDASPLALEAVKSGRMAGTVYQDMVEWGYQSVDVAYKISKGEKYETRTYVPLTAVTKDNIDETIARAKERDETNDRLFSAN